MLRLLKMYGLFYSLGIAFVFPAAVFSKKLRRFFIERIGLLGRMKTHVPRGALWFHVASSGELEQCLSICDSLRSKNPSQKIFLSYFSSTACDAILLERERREKAGRALSWDYADYCPLDFTRSVTSYVKAFQPKKLIVIHREFWLGMLSVSRAKKIPTYLCAVGFPQPSRFLRPWFRYVLSFFDAIAATDEISKKNISQIYDGTVEVLGDPRIDRIFSRHNKKTPPPWRVFFEEQSVMIAASIWPKEFEVLVDSLSIAIENQWRVILVPHERDEKFNRRIMDWSKENQIPMRRWTHWIFEPDYTSHLIVDSVGVLAELYQLSSLVFVGGSLFSRVHNVLEPALFGNAIFTGPKIQNSIDAVALSGEQALLSISDLSRFRDEVRNLIGSKERREKLGTRAMAYMESRTGAASRYVEFLKTAGMQPE